MSTVEQQNSKRIAKNTLLLYFRMLLTMAVGLYTSRVVLQTLGVENFGIYNVVGGVVAMFSVLSGSLSAAISRFLTFELGKNDQKKLNRVFSSAVTIQLCLALIIVVLVESVGFWFLNNKMSIPAERIYAANWVFQLSLVTFCINLVSVPYNAAIIAHEKMSAFAYVSILEALGKLVVAWGIVVSPIDRLIFYAVLMCCVALIIRTVYGWYCKKHFEECSVRFIFDSDLVKQMFSFAGWNFIGASSAVLRDQGGNVLINIFCGPTVNAARGIAVQVNNAVSQFVNNFMMALNPQITKSYASENREYMMTLIFQGARLSFFLMLFLSLPILLNTEYILSVWLKFVPEYTIVFVQLSLIFVMSESISAPLITAMLATGNIRNYQIVVGGIQLLNLPTSYILLRNGYGPEAVLFVAILLSQCCLIARLIMLKKMIALDILGYIKSVYLKVLYTTIIAVLVPYFIKIYLVYSNSFCYAVVFGLGCILWGTLVIIALGCTTNERMMLKNKVVAFAKKVLSR